MAIPAQRFQYLDKETNVATLDFLKVKDNSIYTSIRSGADAVGSAVDSLLNNPAINDLEKSINNVLSATNKQLTGFADMVSASLKDVVNSLKLPFAAVKSALKSLTQFKDKITGMVQSAINLGKRILCPLTGILDFLFGLNKYASITKAMMAGMLYKAMDNINKKLCSNSDRNPSNLLKIPTINAVATAVNSFGKTVLADTGLGLKWNSTNMPKEVMGAANVIRYTKIASSAATTKAGVPTPTSSTFGTFFDNLATDFDTAVGNISSAISGGNITTKTKQYLVDTLNTKMSTLSSTDSNYKRLNQLKVDAINAPMINPLVCRANLETVNLGDKLTLSYKDLMNNTSLDLVNVSTLTDPSDIASISYLKSVKTVASNNPQLTYSDKSLTGPLTVPTTIPGFSSVLDAAVITDNDCHKPNDVPATTTAYIDYSTPKSTDVDLFSGKNATPLPADYVYTPSAPPLYGVSGGSDYVDYRPKSYQVGSDGVPALLAAPIDPGYTHTGIDWDAIDAAG